MALIKCLDCGQPISDKALTCPKCGWRVVIANSVDNIESHKKEESGLIKAFKRRQKDTGWGYAMAHLVPFVGIYYAINRRTITPFLFSFLGAIAIGFTYGVLFAIINPNYDEQELETSGTLIGLVTTPILTKQGMEKARRYAKKRLLQDSF